MRPCNARSFLVSQEIFKEFNDYKYDTVNSKGTKHSHPCHKGLVDYLGSQFCLDIFLIEINSGVKHEMFFCLISE